MSLAQDLTSFFQVMYNRIVQLATQSNQRTRGTAANPQDANTSGNLGGGQVPIGNIAVYPDPKSTSYIREGYSGNSSVFSIVSLISRKFGHLSFKVLEVQDQEAAEDYKHYLKTWDKHSTRREVKALYKKAFKGKAQDHIIKYKVQRKNAAGDIQPYEISTSLGALVQLLKRPNPFYGAAFFQQYVDIYYEANGESMIWLNRGTDVNDIPLTEGPVLEMYVLPPQYMEMIPDPYNVWGYLGWIFNVAGKRIPIAKENVIHWYQPNPNFDGVTREHMRGLSPMRPGRKKLTEDESATDASVAMHQNNGARAIVFDKNLNGPGSKMTATKESEIRGVIDRKVNNNDVKGAVAYVQGDLGAVDLSMSSVDMELEESKGNILARMCNLWGVSPDLLMQGSTYQNVLQARKDLMTNKCLPAGCSFSDELMRVLFPAFGINPKTTAIEIDATIIPELQDDILQLAQALKLCDWITPNEKRREMNFEDDDQEGMNDYWIANTVVRMSDAIMSEQQPDSYDPNDYNNAVEAAKKLTSGRQAPANSDQ